MPHFSFESCLAKQQALKKTFKTLATPEQRYQKIIELGKSLSPYPQTAKTPQHLVSGCQSLMYLNSFQSADGKIFFEADSEALISRGLAALLIFIYNEEHPEVILTCPPSLFEELGIYASLSLSRSNGMSSLFLRMKQCALNYLNQKTHIHPT